MAKDDYHRSDEYKQAKQRRRNRVNIRHNSPGGKGKGEQRWVKARRRVRKNLLGR